MLSPSFCLLTEPLPQTSDFLMPVEFGQETGSTKIHVCRKLSNTANTESRTSKFQVAQGYRGLNQKLNDSLPDDSATSELLEMVPLLEFS